MISLFDGMRPGSDLKFLPISSSTFASIGVSLITGALTLVLVGMPSSTRSVLNRICHAPTSKRSPSRMRTRL